MGRELKNIYCFIFDENRNYYRAKQQHDGSYTVTKDTQFYPIQYNPPNLLDSTLEFGTDMKYLFLSRSINYPLQFIKDGAAILKSLYYFGKGVEQKVFFSIVEWDGSKIPGRYELSYTGRIDFSQKDDQPETGSFVVPLIDESAWGVLSRYDTVKFAFDCSPTNPKAVRVLIDGTTLINTFTYQTVQSDIKGGFNDDQLSHTIPFVLVNQDGDSAGLITKSQSYSSFSPNTFIPPNETQFLETIYDIKGVNISGSFRFKFFNSYADPFRPYDTMRIYFSTNRGKRIDIFSFGVDGANPASRMVNGKIYDIPFNFDWDLASGEKVNFATVFYNTTVITPIVTNIKVRTKTTTEPQVVYGIRSGDLVQEIVSKATMNRFTIDSNFFKQFNKDICISGDALRQIPNAELYTSFEDFFKTFNSLYWMALMNVNGSLWMERASTVYRNTGRVVDLGEALKIGLTPAMDFYSNEVSIGSPVQDMNHPSGRLEFNSTNTFSLNIQSSDSKLDLVTEYITGCYAIQFLMLDYKGGSTSDDQGDKRVFLLRITDEQGTAVDNIETFENITIDNTLLQPVIKSPLNNEVITFASPVIRGVGIVGSTVNIYRDTILDGSTVVDINGNWSYNISTPLSSYDLTHSGVHTIDASYSDLLAALSTISITINTTVQTPLDIVYPAFNDNLYNNKPLIRGVAQAGTNINIVIDGTLVLSTVADSSGKWQYKSTALSNGDHTIVVNGTASVRFHTDTNVSHPLITYIGSEIDGFVVINNLPLIEGVAQPNEIVNVWLNYISYAPLGTTQADANGNWSLQVTPKDYIDHLSGQSVIMAPIQNGLNIFSTSLENFTVGINAVGYKLERPRFNSIAGVPDNTVFNTAYTPKRMLENHYPRFSAMLRNQPQEFVYGNTFDKNGNLVTILGNKVVSERADVSTSELGDPFAILEYAVVKVKAKKTFIQSLYDFSGGNTLLTTYRGKKVFGLPIGGMKLSSIMDTEQEWKFLISTLTSYIDLFDLYKKGIKINIMKHALYHSDKNSIHMVQYDYQLNKKYEYMTMYQDWFSKRNGAWSLNPDYIQKYQQSETDVRDQITTNGLVNVTLRVYRCKDLVMVDTIDYNPVNPAPITPPEVVLEAVIDFSKYPEGQYFFIMMVGAVEVMISERIWLKAKWHKTILIEASSSLNETGAFFSTGFKTVIRVEGIIKKLQANANAITAVDDIGNSVVLYANTRRYAEMRFGTAYGLPDYLYLKIADSIILDELVVENNEWSISQEDKITSSDDVDGHPLYYYTATMYEKNAVKGATVAGGDAADLSGVVLVLNPTALGLPVGGLINIQLDNG